jgi:cysteine desulfurase NifS
VGPRAWREWNVNELTDLGNYDEISGFPVYKALLCDVVKVEKGSRASKQSASHDATTGGDAAVAEPLRFVPKRLIYLDNNATTPVAGPVREAMLPFLREGYGNPSALHRAGRDARGGIETARRQVARLLNTRPRRVVFTGGGSESDNLAIKGAVFANPTLGKHVITSSIEHPAVLQTCRFLEKLGYRLTYLDVDEDGLIAPDKLAEAITDDTVLVSLMMANNEVGSIQPIEELSRVAHERGALFHSDAVQAAGKIEVDVDRLGVDLLSVSAHKFHGPKGIGALYVRKGVGIEPLVHGGKQESGLRGGTENVPAIAGMGKAAELALAAVGDMAGLARLRDSLEHGIRRLIPGARLNGHRERRLPNTLNLTLPGLRGESVVVALDQHGVSLASGSACKSGSPEPTHVLLAMGRTEEEAHCAVRFSLSRETSGPDIEDTVARLARVLEEMETTVRFLPCK